MLLTTKRYHGNPVRQHMLIQGLSPEHFELWLALFKQSLLDIFEADIADRIYQKALRMGDSMQKAIFDVPETWKDLLLELNLKPHPQT
ncbi:MAG: group III truncated hemoglobin [Deinococcales bacterium]